MYVWTVSRRALQDMLDFLTRPQGSLLVLPPVQLCLFCQACLTDLQGIHFQHYELAASLSVNEQYQAYAKTVMNSDA